MATNGNDYGIVDEYAEAHKLLLDLDQIAAIPWDEIDRRLELMGLTPVAMHYRQTARGFHVRIFLTEGYPPPVLVAAQAILGSDARREALNFRRMRVPHWTERMLKRWQVLFARKLKNGDPE